MGSMVNKTIADIYKDMFFLDNSNNGLDTTLRPLTDGNGTASGLFLSVRKSLFRHSVDRSDTFVIDDKDGNAHLTVDTTNDLLRVGASQEIVNTAHYRFADSVTTDGSNHYGVGVGNSPTTELTMGTGTDPDTSYTISTTADDVVNCMWFVDTALTLDAIKIWCATSDAGNDTIRFHLMSYTIDTSNSATGGDLSSGAVVAYGSDISSLGYEQAYQQSLTISTSSISANKVLMLCVKTDSAVTLSINATIKYHI